MKLADLKRINSNCGILLKSNFKHQQRKIISIDGREYPRTVNLNEFLSELKHLLGLDYNSIF